MVIITVHFWNDRIGDDIHDIVEWAVVW